MQRGSEHQLEKSEDGFGSSLQICKAAPERRATSRKRSGLLQKFRANRSGNAMVEFAICGPVFFLLLFVVFETAYDFYLQEVLDTALQATARQIQIGAGQPTTRQNLINNYLCPNGLSFLNCSSLFIRVERVNDTACPGGYQTADMYDGTNGRLPGSNGQLMLGLFGGTGGNISAGGCDTASSSTGFCVAGPSVAGPEYIILTAVYVAPSFLGRLVQNTVKYNNQIVRATMSTAAFVTERFTQNALPQNATTC